MDSKLLEKYGFEQRGPVWVRGCITFRFVLAGYQLVKTELFHNHIRVETVEFSDFNLFTDFYFSLL